MRGPQPERHHRRPEWKEEGIQQLFDVPRFRLRLGHRRRQDKATDAQHSEREQHVQPHHGQRCVPSFDGHDRHPRQRREIDNPSSRSAGAVVNDVAAENAGQRDGREWVADDGDGGSGPAPGHGDVFHDGHGREQEEEQWVRFDDLQQARSPAARSRPAEAHGCREPNRAAVSTGEGRGDETVITAAILITSDGGLRGRFSKTGSGESER